MGDPYYPWFGLRPKKAYSGRFHRRNRGPAPNSCPLIPCTVIPCGGPEGLTYLYSWLGKEAISLSPPPRIRPYCWTSWISSVTVEDSHTKKSEVQTSAKARAMAGPFLNTRPPKLDTITSTIWGVLSQVIGILLFVLPDPEVVRFPTRWVRSAKTKTLGFGARSQVTSTDTRAPAPRARRGAESTTLMVVAAVARGGLTTQPYQGLTPG
jgi:hypothetical protein